MNATTCTPTRPDWEKDWQELLSYLPQDYAQLAKEHKQLLVQHGNAKITTADELLRFIFVHVGCDLPLRQTVAVVEAGGGPRLSAMRLHMKMRRASPYLEALIARMVPVSQQARAELWSGYEMVSVDASSVCGPGAEGTDARIHAVLRLSELSFEQVQLTDCHGGETFRRFHWSPGQLVIGDRGYCNAPGIAHVVDCGAHVLVRYNLRSMPAYDRYGDVVNVMRWLRSLSVGKPEEMRVYVVSNADGSPRWVQGRLVAERLPEKQAEEARCRLRREHGSDVTAEMLETAGYLVVFTTTPRGAMPAKRCLAAYRLRWQVELLFKRCKSLCGFDRLPNYRDDTIHAWLAAKVLLGLIVDRMSSAAAELFPLSPTKEPSSSEPPAPQLRPMARQAWKLTSILRVVLIAALVPFRLSDLPSVLPTIMRRLDADTPASMPAQIPTFRREVEVSVAARRTLPKAPSSETRSDLTRTV